MKYVHVATDRTRELLPIYAATAGAHHSQERRYRPNGALFHHILFVEEGEGVFEVNGVRKTVGAGNAVFIKKELPSLYEKSGESFVTAWVCFDGKDVNGILEYFAADGFSVCPSSTVFPKILNCMNLLRKDAPAESVSLVLYDLLVSYLTELRSAEYSHPIAKAKQFIKEHCGENISIASISQYAGVSQSLLFRLFHELEGITPTQLLIQTRLRMACGLLVSHPRMPISEIANRCGFDSHAYFCMLFKRECGITPSAFRRTYT